MNINAVCVECKECVCLKCLIDAKNIHRPHELQLVEEFVNSVRDKMNGEIIDVDLLVQKSVSVIDDNENILKQNTREQMYNRVIEKYLTDNNITHDEVYTGGNVVYDIVENDKLCLRYDHSYTLITNSRQYSLDPGYYLVIAVGGGGAGGSAFKCDYDINYVNCNGGSSGCITAKILQISQKTTAIIDVGSGGLLQNIDHINVKDYVTHEQKPNQKLIDIMTGKKTTVKINKTDIIAEGGKSSNENCKYHKEMNNREENSCGPVSHFNVYRDDINKASNMDQKIINQISNIFPIVYPGQCGHFEEILYPSLFNLRNMSYGFNGVDKYRRQRLNYPPYGGSGGLCLVSNQVYGHPLPNDRTPTPESKITGYIRGIGFGSGGGGGYCFSYNSKKDNGCDGPIQHIYERGCSGTNGCVIIAKLN